MKIKIMKKSLVLVMTFLFVSLANAGGMSFKCNGYRFSVYDDDSPLEYSMMAGDKIEYNYSGKVTKIGNISIEYNYSGKVTKIGNLRIEYNIPGKIVAIGDMRINYDYSGKMKGTDGSIKCQW